MDLLDEVQAYSVDVLGRIARMREPTVITVTNITDCEMLFEGGFVGIDPDALDRLAWWWAMMLVAATRANALRLRVSWDAMRR